MNEAILRRIYSRLLRESSSIDTTDLAAHFNEAGNGSRRVVLYRVSKLKEILDFDKEEWRYGGPLYNTIMPAIAGFASISLTSDYSNFGNCNGAWMVSHMAGPGVGKIMYGMCYAMAEPNRDGVKNLVSDRRTVSNDASAAWQKAFKSTRPRTELDNVKEKDPSKQKTPGDEYDDCLLHEGRPWLDYAYQAEGWEESMYQGLTAESRRVENELNGKADEEGLELRLDLNIIKAGTYFFSDVYTAALAR